MYPGAFARADPERVAAVMADSGEQLTYRELDDRSRRLSRLLYDAGLRRGDVVALLTDNALPRLRGVLGGAALRPVPDRRQLPPDRRTRRRTSSMTAAPGCWSSRPG